MATARDRFTRFAAIDWSGAKGRSHPGIALAVCEASGGPPALIAPPGRHWSREGIRDWILARASEPMLIGFDMSFCAPILDRGAYLPGESTAADARSFWAWIDARSGDEDLGAASFLEHRRGRHFYLGAADGPKADFIHFRRCEQHFNSSGGGKVTTVYDAIGAAQVAKASFAGMRLLHSVQDDVAIWPFDPVPETGTVVVEIYTAIAARAAGMPKGRSKLRDPAALDDALAALGSEPHDLLARYDDHSTDAILTAAWLRANAIRPELWNPPALTPEIARTEGWTFGIA
jgi:hypothetical protein